VITCRNCAQPGHVLKTCDEPCGRCASEAHKINKCVKCYQCLRWGHHQRDCPEGCSLCGDEGHTGRKCLRIR
jgi:hypothetical protein